MIFFDTHCHIDIQEFDFDRSEVISRANLAGVKQMLIPAVDKSSWKKILSIVESDGGLFAGIGIQPNSANEWTASSGKEIRTILQKDQGKKIKVIGEIGLDNYWKIVPFETQIKAFKNQLDISTEFGLPIVIHSREEGNATQGLCSETLYKILEEWLRSLPKNHPLRNKPGVFHSFSSDKELLNELIPLGFSFGISGTVTYKNAVNIWEVVKFIPSNKLLIETDSPYLTPVPYRGKRNEPAFVVSIAEKIAQILNTKPNLIAAQTTNNARKLFLGEEAFE